MKKTLLSMLVGLSMASNAMAEDLYQVYQQALQNDPTTLKSQASRDSAYAGISLSRANLLPSLSLRVAADSLSGDRDGDSNSAVLTLRQSVFDWSDWKSYDRAEMVATQADASYGLAKQNLIVRTVNAYFDVLQANDDLEFSQAEKRAIERQLEQTKQRFEVGLTAITDVHEAQAQFDNAVASEISAQNAVEISLEALREITGNYYDGISALNTDTFSASMPSPQEANGWVMTAESNNLELTSAKIGVNIAQEDIDIAKTGYYPSVDLLARYTSADDDTITERNNSGYVELAVSVPIYTGGQTNAQVEQARHNFVSQSEERERVHRSVVRSVRSNFFDVTASISRINALAQAVVSAESALKATEAGFEVGTRTIVDVLNSTRNLYDAKRNLARARYGYVLSVLNLKLAAGTLSEQDVIDINNGLVKG